MPRKTGNILQLLAYCWLINLSSALIGKNVRSAAFKDFYYAVSISRRAQNHYHEKHYQFCTGSLISTKTVLTAAHCLLDKNKSEVQVVAGAMNVNRGQQYFPESWITYIEWSTGQKQQNHSLHDVALIILEGEGVKNLNITPATLYTFAASYFDNTRVRMAGWGRTETGAIPSTLRAAGLRVISNEECSREGTKLKGKNFSVPPNYFCSKADPWVVSTCGDGGAPITLNRKRDIIGINIGVCPKLEGPLYATEFANQHKLNSNLNLHYYKDFLRSAAK